MPLDLLLDNDVAIKLCAYRMRPWEPNQPLAARSITALATSQFVITKRLKKCNLKGTRASVIEAWDSLRQKLLFLEPTTEEIDFAAALEVAAQRRGLGFDVGESQLVAIMALRGAQLLLSGDKRAICALAELIPHHSELAPVLGSIACLEQLFAELLKVMEPPQLRNHVCAEIEADRSLSICFQCRSPAVEWDEVIAGLNSYIADLRSKSASVLCENAQILSRTT